LICAQWYAVENVLSLYEIILGKSSLYRDIILILALEAHYCSQNKNQEKRRNSGKMMGRKTCCHDIFVFSVGKL